MDTNLQPIVTKQVGRAKLNWMTVVNRRLAKRTLTNDFTGAILENDPKHFISSLRNPSVSNYFGLRSRLRNASVSWIQSFLASGGFDYLFEALEILSQSQTRASTSVVTAFLQMECVSCIKCVMNTRAGLDFILKKRELSRLLTQGLFFIIVSLWGLFTVSLMTVS